MKSSERYVFDTNVIVSALLFRQSKPGQAFQTALGRGEILLSLPLLHELNDVLSRKKFDRYLLLEERERFLDALIERASLVDIVEQIRACRDPKDDMVLEVAVNGEATSIISGDNDLLQLSPFRGIPVISPDEFLFSISS